MSDFSKVPILHDFLRSIPYFGVTWNEVITSYPNYTHLHWSLVFALLSGLLQLFCYALTKLFAPSLIGYTATPKLPKTIANEKLGERLNYEQQKFIDISHYDLQALSVEYSLSTKEIETFISLCNKHHSDIDKNETRFQECLYPIFTKVFTLSLGFYLFWDAGWLYNGRLFYEGLPDHSRNQSLAAGVWSADMKLLYNIHIGWYFYKVFGQTVLDRHLKDFAASLIHHLSTVMLLGISYHLAFLRIGIAVLLMHDPSDIVLSTAKLCRLMHLNLAMNIGFALLVVTWFMTRIAIFPYQCIYLSAVSLPRYMPTDFCMVLMCGLYVLHIHWFYLIIKALVRALSGAGTTDPRSDVEECDKKKEY